MRIGFIGVGQMGRGMAARLLELGHELVVWNRTSAAAAPLYARGARIARSPLETLDCEVIVTMLADDAAIEQVWIAPQLVREIPHGRVHLNMASVSVRMAQRLTVMHRQCGARYVAAPVFGRPQVAASGELDIVAAGDPDAVRACVPVFEALGRNWFDVGSDPAHANVVKIARNFLLGAIIEGLGEAFALVQKSGVAPATLLDIITRTSMNAPAYKNYGRLMIERPTEATFTLRLGLKDIELALQAADDAAVPLPLGALMRDQHVRAIARGYGDRDWAALGNYIAESARS